MMRLFLFFADLLLVLKNIIMIFDGIFCKHYNGKQTFFL